MSTLRRGSKRWWRPLIGVLVAYAVATQSLLLAIGGFGLPALANDGTPAVELCLHDNQGGSELPAGNPDHTACTHCLFCFAGLHHAVIGEPAACVHRVDIAILVALSVAHESPRPSAPAHSIANPRGPPLVA
jgi:hypothetical protein